MAELPGLFVDLGGGAGLLLADRGGRAESVGVCVSVRLNLGDPSGGGKSLARLGCGEASWGVGGGPFAGGGCGVRERGAGVVERDEGCVAGSRKR